MGTSIPLALSVPYGTYAREREQGLLAARVDGHACVVPGCPNVLCLCGVTVDRGTVWFADRTFTHSVVVIVLARCRGPGPTHRIRVLPADLLPGKTYSISAQESTAEAYLEGGQGLRRTLSTFHGDVPHASTLHGWVGGMGRLARERGPDPPGPPFAVVRQEIDDKISPAFSEIFEESVAVSTERYVVKCDDDADEVRRDDLEFATRLLRAARAALPAAAFPLAECVRLLLVDALVAPPSWWARLRSTAIRHRGPEGGGFESVRPAREAPT